DVEDGARILRDRRPLCPRGATGNDVPVTIGRADGLHRHVIGDSIGIENLRPKAVVVGGNAVLVCAGQPALKGGQWKAHVISSLTVGPSPVKRLSCETETLIGVAHPVTSNECPSAVVSAVSVLTPSVAVTR